MDISIEQTIQAPLSQVWLAWTTPEHITQWNFASPDWCCPKADIELKAVGRFNYRMEQVDGEMGFDFEGEFTLVEPEARIEFKLGDDRKVIVVFTDTPDGIKVSETFTAEDEYSGEQQRQGWLAILTNFKNYVESQ